MGGKKIQVAEVFKHQIKCFKRVLNDVTCAENSTDGDKIVRSGNEINQNIQDFEVFRV